MQTRVAVISMILEAGSDVAGVNTLLHEFAPYILGRMGIPYRARHQYHLRRHRSAAGCHQCPHRKARQAPRREREDHVLRQHLRKRSLTLTPPAP